MSRNLNWTKEAFNRTTTIMDNGQVVGKMQRDGLSQDVEAHLGNVHLLFDVTGFLFHSVNIHDLVNANAIIGKIEFSFGKRAELQLVNGEAYLWKRHNILMRNWDMIREGDADSEGHEVVSYELTRRFMADNGDISIEAGTPNAEIVVLSGLFIRNYFQRRRRLAAAAAS